MRHPIVCCGNGAASWRWIEPSLVCDIIVIAGERVFVALICAVGLVPDAGLRFVWQGGSGAAGNRIPTARGKIDARQALEWGLAYASVPNRPRYSTQPSRWRSVSPQARVPCWHKFDN